jgi:hypothetical protein
MYSFEEMRVRVVDDPVKRSNSTVKYCPQLWYTTSLDFEDFIKAVHHLLEKRGRDSKIREKWCAPCSTTKADIRQRTIEGVPWNWRFLIKKKYVGGKSPRLSREFMEAIRLRKCTRCKRITVKKHCKVCKRVTE